MRKIIKTLTMAALLAYSIPALAKESKPVEFGAKPTKEYAHALIQQYLNQRLFDPYSAHIECGEVTEKAWVIPVLFAGKRYGYFVVCDVNAKNKFGAYVGAQRYLFRFNGEVAMHEEEIYRFGLYDGP